MKKFFVILSVLLNILLCNLWVLAELERSDWQRFYFAAEKIMIKQDKLLKVCNTLPPLPEIIIEPKQEPIEL